MTFFVRLFYGPDLLYRVHFCLHCTKTGSALIVHNLFRPFAVFLEFLSLNDALVLHCNHLPFSSDNDTAVSSANVMCCVRARLKSGFCIICVCISTYYMCTHSSWRYAVKLGPADLSVAARRGAIGAVFARCYITLCSSNNTMMS